MNIKCTIWWKSVHSLLLYHLSISVIVIVYMAFTLSISITIGVLPNI